MLSGNFRLEKMRFQAGIFVGERKKFIEEEKEEGVDCPEKSTCCYITENVCVCVCEIQAALSLDEHLLVLRPHS